MSIMSTKTNARTAHRKAVKGLQAARAKALRSGRIDDVNLITAQIVSMEADAFAAQVARITAQTMAALAA